MRHLNADPASGRLFRFIHPIGVGLMLWVPALALAAPGSPASATTEGTTASQPNRASTTWEQRFNEVYRMADGEILKRIAPPFIPERSQYCQVKEQLGPKPPTFCIFRWDGLLKFQEGTFQGEPPTLNDVLISLGFGRHEFEGPAELLNIEIPGDWIQRKNCSREQCLEALEGIVARELHMQIRFQRRQVEHDAIVVRGAYRFRPLIGLKAYPSQRVNIFGDSSNPDRRAGSGTDDLPRFLWAVANWVNCPIVNEAHAAPGTIIDYIKYHSSELHQLPEGEQKTAKLRAILANLEAQMSLVFRLERRPVEMWLISKARADTQPSQPASAVP